MTEYSLDNAWDQASRRLSLLEGELDPISHRRLRETGISAGCRCLEVGGGGGSITRWLCEQVGPDGYVLATDVEPTLLEQVHFPQLETRRHDILNDPPPAPEFDVVHARWLLHHLPDPVEAMRRMVSAVRPGGWIVFEEPDFSPILLSSSQTYTAFMSELARVAVAGSGGDCFWARNMLAEIGGLELEDIGAEGDQFIVQGGAGWAEFFSLTSQQIRTLMTSPEGALNEDAFNAGVTLLAEPEVIELGPTGIAVWGRKAG
jgi:SAM-dependent methyltransferase